MPNHIELAYEGEEPFFMYDRHKDHIAHKVDASRIEGAVKLERFIEKVDGPCPAMLLARRKWKDLYLVNIREGWTEDDYFKLAEKAIKDHGILYP